MMLFVYKTELTIHVKDVHENKKGSYKCGRCEKYFATLYYNNYFTNCK